MLHYVWPGTTAKFCRLLLTAVAFCWPLQPALPQEAQPQQQSWVVPQADGCDDSLRPLLDAVLPRELVSGSRGHVQAAALGSSGMSASGSGSHLGSVGSPFGGAALPHTRSRQSAGEFSSVGDTGVPSRVTSFDMLSVGNPWGDLQPPNGCALANL